MIKHLLITIVIISASSNCFSQNFTRSELPAPLTYPWEITYGPDNYLWITELGGEVSRVDPSNGNKTVIYSALDYFSGSPLENSPNCYQPSIGYGTFGLALHPDFLNPSTSYVYFVYSYNSGTVPAPATKFKIKRLTWDAATSSVINDTDIVTLLPTGYDHLGGRLLAVKRNNTSYLFLSSGDNGISEINQPSCYVPQSTNPNNFAQDTATKNGKIHRFNMDGSIPTDNPLPLNSFYTRGHRNPQGLMYNYNLDVLYDVEHGDRTDDEINILYKGMNYGWKDIRGYHNDGSFPGELAYYSSYIPNSNISGDSLVDPFYAWCTTTDTSNFYLDWCTVAPSDGIYYGSTGIPEWTNSLLVVTLKNGLTTDQQVFQFKLDANGDLIPSSSGHPNPSRFFGEDQNLNGRLRDITFSPDGKTIYLINNGGAPTDKITVYTYVEDSLKVDGDVIQLFPNPANSILTIKGLNQFDVSKIQITTSIGEIVAEYNDGKSGKIDVSHLSSGLYIISIFYNEGSQCIKFVKE